MKSAQYYISEMNRLLDLLLDTAKKLRDLTHQVISKEEVVPLQRAQDEIIHQLEKFERDIPKQFSQEIHKQGHDQFHAKIKKFQELNQEFITNFHHSQGLIQFELKKLKEESEEEGVDLGLQQISKFLPQEISKKPKKTKS